MKRSRLKVFWMLIILCTGVSHVYAQAVPFPFRIGGTVTIDGVQITQATDNGLVIKVTKQNGTDYTDANGNPPKDNDGLNNTNWYLVDVPIFGANVQTGGANTGETAVIGVFVDNTELTVKSPADGIFQIGNGGITQRIDIEADNETSWVDLTATNNGTGTFESPFNNLGAAINAAISGSTITIKAGTFNGPLNITKKLTLKASGGTVIIGK